MKKRPATPYNDLSLVAQLTAAVSIASFFYYLRHGDLLLYGDAVAHINIARRVFDSQTPGPLQLGTVWLPLPHILMLPFIVSRWMWSDTSFPLLLKTRTPRGPRPRGLQPGLPQEFLLSTRT